MLTAIPTHWFSWAFSVQEGSTPVAQLDVSYWREKGTLSILGKDYHVGREGWLDGYFYLEHAGTWLARANKPSAFRRIFEIEHGAGSYQLKPKSSFERTFLLLQGDQEVGRIRPVSVFSRQANVDLPEELPLPVRVFILWLVVILWKRESEASSG